MGTRRRIGGLPLAVYVLALLLIPLTAVGFLSAREVSRNNAEASTADRVAAAASADEAVAAITVPLEIERSLMIGLAYADELGMDLDQSVGVTGFDVAALLEANGAELDAGWAMLRPFIVGTGSLDDFDELGEQLSINRTRALAGEVSSADVEVPFEGADRLIADVFDGAADTVRDNPLASATANRSVQRLDVVLDVLTTGVDEMRAYLTAVLGTEGNGMRTMENSWRWF